MRNNLLEKMLNYEKSNGLGTLILAGVRHTLFQFTITHQILGEMWKFTHGRKTKEKNPVLDFSDVDDYGRCQYIADPFLTNHNGELHMFFEVYNPNRDPDAVIGHAVYSKEEYSWNYNKIVLNTGNHLSFPYVFSHNDNYYMMPEEGGRENSKISIYKCVEFPEIWEKELTLLETDHMSGDSVIFKWKNRWWLLCGNQDCGLYAYYSKDNKLKTENWTPHEENPIRRPNQLSRLAGRPIILNDKIILFLQDCRVRYGDKVFGYEVQKLSIDAYVDDKISTSPLLEGQGTLGWNSSRMHHIDSCLFEGDRVYSVDGNSKGEWLFDDRWSIGIIKDLDNLDGEFSV